MNNISIHKSLFVLFLFLQSLSAQIDVSKELGQLIFYDIELSKHTNYFKNKTDNKEIDSSISIKINSQIENFKNLDNLISNNDLFKVNFYDIFKYANISDLSGLTKNEIILSKNELFSSAILMKTRILAPFITVYFGDQFLRSDRSYNYYNKSNSIDKYNFQSERDLNEISIKFLIDLYEQIESVDFQSDFGKEYAFEEIVIKDLFGWKSNQYYFSKSVLLMDLNDKIVNYFSLVEDDANYNSWLQKKINLMMETEIGITPFYEEDNPVQCPKSCEINTLNSFYVNKGYNSLFFFELELLDVISQLTENNIQTNYSNIEISKKLFSIFNILKPRLDGKDGAYGDINYINEELSNSLSNDIFSYDLDSINKNEFKALVSLEISEIFLDSAFNLFQSGYVNDAITFTDNGIEIFEDISFDLIENLSFKDNYVLESYIYTFGNVQFFPFLISMISISSLEDIQKTEKHPNNDKALKLARQLKIDPITIGDFKGMIALANRMEYIFSDLISENGFDYNKTIKKIDKMFVDSGMNEESAKNLRKGMMQGLMATSKNSKIKKKDFDELIKDYNTSIENDPLNVQTYIDFVGFLTQNNELYLKFYNESFFNLALEIAFDGLNETLKEITIYDVQKNPSYYSNHFFLMNEYINIKSLIYESNYTDGDNRFNQLLYEINAKDKVRDVLLEPNQDLSLLSYFFDNNDTRELLQTDIYDGMIFYNLTTKFGQNTAGLVIYFIEPLRETDEDEYLWQLHKEIVLIDEETTPFLFSKNTGSQPGSLIDRVNLFNSLISKNIDTNIYQKEFYNLLIEPINHILEDLDSYTIPYFDKDSNQKNILIIGDTHLSKIPFDALIDKNDKYFMEDYVISYAKSFKSIHRTLNKHNYNNYFSINSKSSLLIGGIPYEDYNYNKKIFNNLEFSIPEISSILEYNPKSSVLKKEDALETNIKNFDFANINYLHFSTHGTSDLYDYFNSSLILGPDNENDGLLKFNEICALDLSNTDLVFLSACQTSSGKDIENIGSLSLNDAFIIAGAQSVISTLWMIDDKATSIFVDNFHSNNFIRNNKSYKYAPHLLNKAKLNFISNHEEYKNPYYWAGFVSYGL